MQNNLKHKLFDETRRAHINNSRKKREKTMIRNNIPSSVCCFSIFFLLLNVRCSFANVYISVLFLCFEVFLEMKKKSRAIYEVTKRCVTWNIHFCNIRGSEQFAMRCYLLHISREWNDVCNTFSSYFCLFHSFVLPSLFILHILQS